MCAKLAISTALCLLGLPTTPHAQEARTRVEVTPWLGYAIGGTLTDRVTDEELELDDSGSYGLAVNILASNRSSWEIAYSRQETEADTRGLSMTEPAFDLNVDKLEFGGTYDVYTKYPRPYVAATIGLTKLDPSGTDLNSDTYFSFSLGGGLKLLEKQRIGLRLDARWLGTVIQDDTDIFCRTGTVGAVCLIEVDGDLLSQVRLSLGISIRF